MWRPDNWAEIKRKLCDERLKNVGGAQCETCPVDPQTCGIPQEETVNAFLEAIRKRGFVSGESLSKAKGANGWRGISFNSKWYSIPDDE